jgi:hypothetical protein
VFGPQKSPPHGGNYAQAGARDIRCKAREVTLSRNVIGWMKVIAKLGRTVAAGRWCFRCQGQGLPGG